MTTTVNIGLMTGASQPDIIDAHLSGVAHASPHTPAPIDPDHAAFVLSLHASVIDHRVDYSDDEPTLIATLAEPLSESAALWICLQLQQIAIAQSDGKLLGPLAPLWGAFNRDLFKEI